MRKHFEKDTEKIIKNNLLLESRGWKLVKCQYPDFLISMLHPKSKKEYVFWFLCNDYPISMQVVDPKSFNPVPFAQWPQGSSFLERHTLTQKPFLCIPGLREYHTHDSHKNETQWIFPCNEFRLPRLLDRVFNKFINSNS